LRLFSILIGTILLLATSFSPAQEGETAEVGPSAGNAADASRDLFRVGYLRREVSGHPPIEGLERLRGYLEEDEAVQRELEAGEYDGIGLFPCDGPADMVRRLNAREFDVAFAPANLYAQQQAGYMAVLKSRRPEDFFSPTGRVWRQGVVFVTPRSPLYDAGEITKENVGAFLSDERLAVVSTQSVAGFQAPVLRLATDYDVFASEGGYLWFDSSEEVAKGVLSGLADIGACEESALQRVLRRAGLEERKDELIRVILRTDRITTDPVIFRPGLSPRVSALGREIRSSIRDFSLEGGLGEIQYTLATDQEYGSLIELQKEFQETVGVVAR